MIPAQDGKPASRTASPRAMANPPPALSPANMTCSGFKGSKPASFGGFKRYK